MSEVRLDEQEEEALYVVLKPREDRLSDATPPPADRPARSVPQ